MEVRVLQGHSVCYGGIWFNQGEAFECREGDKFETTQALYDQQGKYLGQEVVTQVETISEKHQAPAPQEQKEEG